MHISLASLVGLVRIGILPFIVPLEVILALMYQSLRDNRRYHQRYGYAWDEYCSRVK